MNDPLLLYPLLLVPVIALLFLNLRLSRRIRYPHQLLGAEQRRGLASLLFRTLRGQYDILVDAAIALVLAFAIAPAGLSHPRPAVVVDCSRTMLAGLPGQRPLDLALRRILTEPALRRARPFALVFDAKSRGTRLVPIDETIAALRSTGGTDLSNADIADAADRLRRTFSFFAPDYSALVSLRSRGYGDVTLVTDHLRFDPVGFSVEETGATSRLAAYPASVRYDRTAGSWLVVLAETGPRLPLIVSAWDAKAPGFVRLGSTRYAIEYADGGRRVRFAAPGLYQLSIRAPGDEVDIDLPMDLRQSSITATAVGSFSERMLSVFPLLVKSPHPELALVDKGGHAPVAGRIIRTALEKTAGEYLLDPGLTGGALVPAGFDAGADFSLGPTSLADPDLVLAYDSAIRGLDQGLAQSVPPSSTALLPVGQAYLARVGGALVPLIAPPDRYFELPAAGRIELPPPTRGRILWAFLLAALAAGKLALWRRFSGKKLLFSD